MNFNEFDFLERDKFLTEILKGPEPYLTFKTP